MGVTIRSSSRVPETVRLLRELGAHKIKVGVFGEDGSELVTIARANEFGVTIKPKNGKYLTIPSKLAKGKGAREFQDLRFVPTKNGGLLVKDTVKRGGQVRSDIYFYLVKEVTIPERSFIRAGFDNNVDFMMNKIKQYMNMVIAGRLSADTFLNMIGMEWAGKMQLHLRNLSSPPNAAITKENKGSSNPLVNTGRLVGAIRHKIE